MQCAFYYLLIALAVMAFGAVYKAFGHGVYSWYMLYAFAFPLFGGTLPFLSIGLCSGKPYPTQTCISFYHCGIATWTVGSIGRGVLEIYGTTNALVGDDWVVVGILIIAEMGIKVISHKMLNLVMVKVSLVCDSSASCRTVQV